ncbi:hypothetical protein [Oceanithermus desulfurans]
MKKVLFSLMLALGLAFALPAHMGQVNAPFDEAVRQVEAAMSAAGFPLEKILDVGLTIRSRGYEFPPLYLMMFQPDAALKAAVLDDPRVGTLVPVTVAVMAGPQGQTMFTVVDWASFAPYFELNAQNAVATELAFAKIYGALSTLSPLQFVPLPMLDALRAPYVGGKVTATDDLEEAILLTETGYQDRNMNVVGRTDFGGVHQLWLCNAEIARDFFGNMFPIASRAPCRAVVWKQGDRVYMVASDPAINPQKVDPKAFPPSLMRSFMQVLEMNGGVLEDLGIGQ